MVQAERGSEPDGAWLSVAASPMVQAELGDVSHVELLLLVCLKKLQDREEPTPHTLRMVLREYTSFAAAARVSEVRA